MKRPSVPASAFCAIDFGTSNSALALLDGAQPRLALLEAGRDILPTAVFYAAEDGRASFGRTAIAAYVDGVEGRLMRSIKSILGSDLIDEVTEIAPGRVIAYRDIVIAYLRHLLRTASPDTPPTHAVIGRPVFFVDDDPQRDAQAQDTLAAAARAAGLAQVSFEFEPIAAALDFESTCSTEQRVLVADVGGGTSDFSIVRVGPQRRRRADRRDDILANHGVHLAGTDFDRAINLAAIQPRLGFGSASVRGYPVPGGVYFDLATWHLINTVYAPARIADLRRQRALYAQPALHARLLRVVQQRLGHLLAARAEAAKIELSEHGQAAIDLAEVEPDLRCDCDANLQAQALAAAIARIAESARETLRLARLQPGDIDVLYFTGGSTALQALTAALAAVVPQARTISGDRHTSVVRGLALAAQRRLGRCG